LAAEAPERKTQQAQESQQAPWLRPCALLGFRLRDRFKRSRYGLNFNDI
jgi:hypothetical protein